MANENQGWGYGSIEGALLHLGHDVSRSKIARVLKGEGIEPAPDRKKGMTWAEFLSVHWEVMAATDFFTTEIWTPSGLVRYHILFVIRLATREVKVIGMIPEPHKVAVQKKRNLNVLICIKKHRLNLQRITIADPTSVTIVIKKDASNIRERNRWGEPKAILKAGTGELKRWHWTGTVFTLDKREMKGDGHLIIERGYEATRKGLDGFREQFRAEEMRRGLGQVGQTIIIGDGAAGIGIYAMTDSLEPYKGWI